MTISTWNPSDKSASATLSNSDLTVVFSAAGGVRSVFSTTTGKWYWETTCNVAGASICTGMATSGAVLTTVAANSTNAVVCYNGSTFVNNVVVSGVGITYSASAGLNVLGIAVDLTARRIWFRNVAANGNWNNNVANNPATGVGGIDISALTGALFALVAANGTNANWTADFGQTSYVGAVPSGFTAAWGDPPATRDLRIAGVVRESLITFNPALAVAGVVRETLIAGDRVEGAAQTKSALQAQLTITGGVTTIAGGAGGGGAAGLFGPGEYGQSGVYDGTGGYGGAGDNYLTSRQLTPSTTGNTGTEYDGTYGSGSGGSGGSWGGSGHGGNGGVGGLYGGGGGGGGGGLAGGGLGALGGEGAIYLEYDPGTGPIVIILTRFTPSPFTFPANWSTTNNTVLIIGAGGCGGNGGLTTGGSGGGGGSVVGAINTSLFSPGQILPISIPSPAQVCAGTGGNTLLGTYSAPPGVNGNGSTGGTPAVPISPSDGGIPSGGPATGGGGGPGTGGAGGGVAVLFAVRAEAHSQNAGGMLALELAPRQHAVSVQTWHW